MPATAMSDQWRFAGRRLLRAWFFAAVAGATFVAGAADHALAATVRIQYLSSTNVYLDAGRDAGLAEGTIVRVERQGKVIAELVVEFVAQASASCTIRSASGPLRAGDACSFTPVAGAAPAPAKAPSAPAGAGAGARAGFYPRSVRGSITSVYTQADDAGGTYSNPAVRADLRWRGRERQELALRARADRPVWDALASGAGTRPRDVHLYEASARYASPTQRLVVEGGRLVPMHLEQLGSVDGGSAVVRAGRGVRAGVAGGRGSDAGTSGAIRQGAHYGGWVEMSRTAARGVRRLRTVVSAARIEDTDVTRRQFVQWRTDAVLGARVRLFEHLEVDVNPPWKRQRGEPHVDVANWSVAGQIDLHRRWDVMLGCDAVKDRLLPEHRAITGAVALDESRGVRIATRIGVAKRTSLRLATDLRDRSGDDDLRQGWDASLLTSTAGRHNLTLVVHGSSYETRFGTSRLTDGSVAVQAAPWLRVDLGGGVSRHEDALGALSPSAADAVSWVRGGLGVQPGMGVWLGATGEWRSGTGGRELTLELGRHF
jgi:hypothetical protein